MESETVGFQVFAKPAGADCNLGCQYCYYLKNRKIYPGENPRRMSDEILEAYIRQHIGATNETDIFFSWHGGEPTLAGIGFFQKVVELQQRYKPDGRNIFNGIQTNGTLLNEAWCRFFLHHHFTVGISMDGPPPLHDQFRLTRNGQPTNSHVMAGYKLLAEHGIPCEILCVVNAINVNFPLEIYRYFKSIGARFITFLPLVEKNSEEPGLASPVSVPPLAFGNFLSAIFDEWADRDIGKITIQIFEEALRTSFGQDHSLCIFRESCGRVPALELNGDFYSCDHFISQPYLIGNIMDIPLSEMLESRKQMDFGNSKYITLPEYCLNCHVREMCNGECPRNRFCQTPDGQPGLNYLCDGYKLFFSHFKPFADQVAELWKSGQFRT